MARHEATEVQVTNVRIRSSDIKVKHMAGFVRWLSDVLNVVKRVHQLQQLDCMYVISLVLLMWTFKSPHTTNGHLYATSCSKTANSSSKNSADSARLPHR